MQVHLHGSTAPQSTTNFTAGTKPFAPAMSASTILSQAEKSTDKGFLTTVVDFVTSIPGKIWGFVQWLFCCNATPLTIAGFLDNPDGFARALAKDPVQGLDQFLEDLLSDPKQLVTLIKTLSNGEFAAKSSLSNKENNQIAQKISKALLGNLTPEEVQPLYGQALKVAIEKLIPSVFSGLVDILDTIRASAAKVNSADARQLSAYLARAIPTLRAFGKALPRLFMAIERAEEQQSVAAQNELMMLMKMAMLGIPEDAKLSQEVMQERAQIFETKLLPLLMKVLQGAMATPSEEGIPGLQVNLKEPLMGLLAGTVGQMLLSFTEPLKDKMPLARIVHERLDAFLKEDGKAVAFVTTLLNVFAPNPKGEMAAQQGEDVTL